MGTVTKVSPGSEPFLNIRVRPAADLSRLEEVLVITQQLEEEASAFRRRIADAGGGNSGAASAFGSGPAPR